VSKSSGLETARAAAPRFRVQPAPRLGLASAYALAILLPAVGFAVQAGARGLFERTPFLAVSLASSFVAWAAGVGPAAVTVALSSFLGYLFLQGSPDAGHRGSALLVALSSLPVGAFMGALGALVRLGFQERESSARALQESEHLYRMLFDLAPYGVALVKKDGRMVAFNAHAHQELGYTREAFEKLTIADLEAEENPDEIRRHIDKIQETGADDFIGHHRSRSGEVRETWVQVRTVKIGDEVLQLTTWRDVTEQRRLEKQLAESQKMESVGRLAGGVAHDFNNLLTVVLCSTETMREDLAAGRGVDAEDVDSVRSAGERARDLTRQLLAFASRQFVTPDVLDLNEVVRGTEKLLRRVLGEDVVVSTRLQPELWRVRCDPAQLEQVILNLAANARDAMPEGGHLLLDTANVEVGEAPPHPVVAAGQWVRLSVHDSGAGMAPEVKAHLFEPFFTTKATGRGTGLGLATVYGIVKQSGGQIRVESDPAQGTTFDIFLPRCVAAKGPIPELAEDRAHRGAGTVLLVEDDAGVREVAARALREGGYRVLAASGAGEAMELAARAPGPVDILVTDVIMPGVNGKALAQELLLRRPAMRVLFVSGYADDILGRQGVLEPGVEFLAKPFTPAALVSRVGTVLHGR
jgi:two-component system cell cycle sensor histidine kinase/response regulator CckA